MNLEKRATTTLASLAEQSTKVLALLGAALLIMSVCYDYSYLKALGLSFNEVPSLTTEHVRSAMLWGPYIALLVVGLAVQELVLRRVEHGLTEEEIRRHLSPRELRFRKSPPLMTIIILTLSAIASFFTSTDYQWVFICFIVFWIALAVSIVRHRRMGAGLNSTSALLFGVVPVVLALVAWFGYSEGSKLVASQKSSWELTIRVGSTTTKHSVLGLRRFSTFAITVDELHYVSVIPNDAILSAKRLDRLAPPVSNLCRWFDLGCAKKIPTKAAPVPSHASSAATK